MTNCGIECPECGKNSVVPKNSGSTEYVCLSCKFKKNSNPPPPKKEPPKLSSVAFFGAIAFLIASVLSQLRPTPNRPINLTPNLTLNQQIVR
ncbi:MAG TPA: hypothetical protein IGS17_15185 [Oscillatoriales cyanobacterium M59_W2019_021]|nr:hypothetical protein [Oscillatoriales cyanobacterium M4454_W2019_049]HIK52250.1 hypothetical protein [Oscillatoriales cyanobacterium M59_W2019_021]